MKALLFTLLILFYPIAVSASEPIKVTYALYAGGVNVVDIKGTYNITKNSYDLNMDLKTVGTLGKLAPWSGVLKTQGKNIGIQSKPSYHEFASTWRGETETSYFKFDKAGTLKEYKKIESDGAIEDKMPPEDVYSDNPVDMLSAMFRAMNNSSCEMSNIALDGKRKFDLIYRSKGTEQLTKNRYSIYSGQAEICEVEIKPISGKWHDKPRGWMGIQQQAKNNNQLPQLWFGKVREDMPPIPVRFFIKTNYGAMVMHLKSID
jgi:hypothetical protein